MNEKNFIKTYSGKYVGECDYLEIADKSIEEIDSDSDLANLAIDFIKIFWEFHNYLYESGFRFGEEKP